MRVRSALLGLVFLGIGFATQAYAFHCPIMVKENRALIARAEKTSLKQSAAEKIAQARQLTDEALQLHENGKHVQAMIKANQAATILADIALAALQ